MKRRTLTIQLLTVLLTTGCSCAPVPSSSYTSGSTGPDTSSDSSSSVPSEDSSKTSSESQPSSGSQSTASSESSSSKEEPIVEEKAFIDFDFNSHEGPYIENKFDGNKHKVDYLFNESNAHRIFKAPSDPLFKQGVGEDGTSLYLDGHSNKIAIRDQYISGKRLTLSAWIAPRGFENLVDYDYNSVARGQPRLSSILNQGDMESGEGFTFGYGRLGKWGLQLNLHNNYTGEDSFYGVYDPLHTLELYKWNHIAVTFDGDSGYVGLFYNGVASYETILPSLEGSEIIPSYETLYMGYYVSPQYEFGCNRQLPAGLIDNLKIYDKSLSPKQIQMEYQKGCINGRHPDLPFEEVQIDRAQYEGDRYRAVYHGIPPGVWMNEPHSPIYYKGMYHLFYQHDPIGPYWSQIRWAHWASEDMIHWVAVKDAVVPTPGICPEGVWTGGSVVGPDGTPWLVITAGTNQSTWTGQNIAYAHCVDPDDPYLTDWIVENKVSLTQPADDSQGEREQFRDPFVWYDDETKQYFMLVSTSIPGKGGSANVYTSPDMRDWLYHGYLYECPFDLYPVQGAHWECVIMLPIRSKDGQIRKWILFDCPQYTVDGYVVDCIYWVGQFDKRTCRFIPDSDEPRLFDLGKGIYTGQTGFCYRTEEDIASGARYYEDGRTVLFGLAQGKSAGTEQNIWAGWAHSLAMPVELWLDDDGYTVLREPIKELESAYKATVFEYDGEPLPIEEMNEKIDDVRGDTIEIKAKLSFAPTADTYKSGLYVRYNKNEIDGVTERTALTFHQNGFFINRLQSSEINYVDRGDTNTYLTDEKTFDMRVLIDHSCLEVYLNNKITFTTRIYPKFGNSDYLHFFDDGGGMKVSDVSIKRLGSVYFDETTPSYYGNTGNLGEE